MTKGQRAGESAIAVDVEQGNLIIGVVVVKVPNNHSVMAHIKELILIQ